MSSFHAVTVPPRRGGRSRPAPSPLLRFSFALAGVGFLALAMRPARGEGETARRIDFLREVKPILAAKCFPCHGPDAGSRKADLRLDIPEGAFAERDGEPAVVPGKPEESALVARIEHGSPRRRMPPPKTKLVLSDKEKALLREWIRQGAHYATHWAYAPPQRHAPPESRFASRASNFADAFVLARLEREGLEPAPEAGRRTLLRRLSLDLTGLLPEPDDLERFLGDPRPDAFEREVDRLLASPHFGERMAVYWLDVVRYADTVGYHGDQEHAISPFRDWVIDAFNGNMPFDRFTVAQIAGDLFPAATIDDRIATGYNRVLQTTHEGGAQDKEYRAIYMADRVRNLSAVWLGSTMGCAQCHDHKYDPFTMQDFYSMAAFFADIQEQGAYNAPNTSPTRRPPEIEVLSRRNRTVIAEIEREIEELEAALQAARAAQEAAAAARVRKMERRLETLRAEKEAFAARKRRTMVTVATKPREIRILPRGNWLDDSGPVVEPAVPAFLGRLETKGRRATRLDLARWLVSSENPLTARVMVNRFWYLFFGEGLSSTLDNFGSQGDPPSHPELLDTLAVEFRDSGWDVKRIVRLLVTTRTYRETSRAPEELRRRDPYNRLFARQSAFRLPAEFIRDVLLQASDLLVREIGGPSVRPYQPAGYYRHLNFPKRTYKPDRDRRQWRRGLYVHWQRQFLHPMLLAFDAPSREECTAKRAISNTPKQALALLNDPSYAEAARVFAANALQRGGSTDRERIGWMFLKALSRPPAAEEADALLELLREHRKEFAADPKAAEEAVSAGIHPKADLDPAEHAAWTSVARVILNLDETITRS